MIRSMLPGAVLAAAVMLASAGPARPATSAAEVPDSITVTVSSGSINRISPFDTESKGQPAWCVTISLRAVHPPTGLLLLLTPATRAAPARLTAATLAAARELSTTGPGRPAPPRHAAGTPVAHDEAGRPLFRVRLDPDPRARLDPAGRRLAEGLAWFDSTVVGTREYRVVVFDSAGVRRAQAGLEVKP